MSGLGQSIAVKNYNIGIQHGMQQGINRGRAEAAAEYQARIAELETQLKALKA